MGTRVTVKRALDLNRSRWWTFWLVDGFTLILDEYEEQSRLGPRRKWRTDGHYERILKRPGCMLESEVPLPEDVKADAISQVVHQLRVMSWEEYRR